LAGPSVRRSAARPRDPPAPWPRPGEVGAALAERLRDLLDAQGDLLAEIIGTVMASQGRVLSPDPRPPSSIVVVAACVSAGGAWRRALWPAVAMECALAAADVFDDLADAETAVLPPGFGGGVLLIGAAGLLALASHAAPRADEDGVPAGRVLALGRVLGADLAQAADGQARAAQASPASGDVVEAYELAARKSGPLGSLAARLGALSARADRGLLRLYGAYGWHLGVYSQLMNDARDASPGAPPHKRDLRDARPTVPLIFVGSSPAPADLGPDALVEWEESERRRVVAGGGITAAYALAHAERLRALQALDALAGRGRPVRLLADLLGVDLGDGTRTATQQ
jgi:geranylgeranyl pyrophosphate synthase